jgi:hypothetical protein
MSRNARRSHGRTLAGPARFAIALSALVAIGGLLFVSIATPYGSAQAAAAPHFDKYPVSTGPAQHLTVTPVDTQTISRDGYTVQAAPTPTPTPTPAASSASSSDSDSSDSTPTVTVTPDPGSAQAYAQQLLASMGMGDDQFQCLVQLWNRESGWRVNAENVSSGAYGIPQALPGSKMASAGPDWQTNAATQIQWGLGYVDGRYGTPCGAWAQETSAGWY